VVRMVIVLNLGSAGVWNMNMCSGVKVLCWVWSNVKNTAIFL
jgi:hypothetical protein